MEPELAIVGPILEASKYYVENDTLRTMFAKLLASAMNRDKTSIVHTAYIEIIKQVSPLEAVFISDLFQNKKRYGAYDVRVYDDKSNPNSFKQLFDLIPLDSARTVSYSEYWTAIDNLQRLSLISFNRDSKFAKKDIYNDVKTHPLYHQCQTAWPDGKIKINQIYWKITTFGFYFCQTCVE